MDADLIRAHRDLPQLMPFLHLPVQSGSDAVLEAMNRRYTADDYRRLVDALRAARPDLALSSDFIVGFPGRDRRRLRRDHAASSRVGFAQAFSFKYSPVPARRPPALRRHVPEQVKAARLQPLQALPGGQAGGLQPRLRRCHPARPARAARPPSGPAGRPHALSPGGPRRWARASRSATWCRSRSPRATRTAWPAAAALPADHREGATRLSTLAPLPDLRGSSHRIRFDDNAACAVLFGQHHLNLARIEQKLPVASSPAATRCSSRARARARSGWPRPCSRISMASSSAAATSAATRSTPRCACCRTGRPRRRARRDGAVRTERKLVDRPLAQPGGLSARARPP